MNIRKTRYVIGIAGIALGVGIVVSTSLPKSMQYYVTVDELDPRESRFLDRELKVAGHVVPGSIVKPEGELLWAFDVAHAGRVVSVIYKGAMPDTFKEGADVVVTGRLSGDSRIEATHVLAKCASRYEEKLTPSHDLPAKERS